MDQETEDAAFDVLRIAFRNIQTINAIRAQYPHKANSAVFFCEYLYMKSIYDEIYADLQAEYERKDIIQVLIQIDT